MTDRHIVSIDLGTSKIALTVAHVNGGDVQIVYYKETPSAGIRYSSVYNQNHVKEPLLRAVREAEDCLGIKITQAVVGMSRYPIRQEANTAFFPDRGYDTDITSEDFYPELQRICLLTLLLLQKSSSANLLLFQPCAEFLQLSHQHLRVTVFTRVIFSQQ